MKSPKQPPKKQLSKLTTNRNIGGIISHRQLQAKNKTITDSADFDKNGKKTMSYEREKENYVQEAVLVDTEPNVFGLTIQRKSIEEKPAQQTNTRDKSCGAEP